MARAGVFEAGDAGAVEAELLSIASEIARAVARKHHDYGGSFDRLLDEIGPAGFAARVGDKYYRLKALLIDNRRPLVDESVEDTVRDLAGYALLYLRYLGRRLKQES